MSKFEVKVVRVADVYEHPNADKLTIVKIGGYECISNKKEDGSWRYQKGDLVVYIPEAAVVPDWILKKMGFWDAEKQKGILSGKKGNRVKAIKLRGVVSQGILFPVTTGYAGEDLKIPVSGIERMVPFSGDDPFGLTLNPNTVMFTPVSEGQDVSELLGITKYEPEIPAQMRGALGSLYGYTHGYDLENILKNPDELIEGENVRCTEKIHGTLMEVGFIKNPPEDKKEFLTHVYEDIYSYVTSKGLAGKGLVQKSIPGNQENLYVRAYKLHVQSVAEKIVNELFSTNYTSLWIFGEVFGKGIQDLGYGFSEPQFRIFDVKKGDVWLDSLRFAQQFSLDHVPVVFEGPYDLEKLKTYRDGKTIAGNSEHIREGIVIESTTTRKKYKFVSPDYLMRKNGTEYN